MNILQNIIEVPPIDYPKWATQFVTELSKIAAQGLDADAEEMAKIRAIANQNEIFSHTLGQKLWTTLERTSDPQKWGFVELLIGAGADVNFVTSGQSVLDRANGKRVPKHILDMLVANGAKTRSDIIADRSSPAAIGFSPTV